MLVFSFLFFFRARKPTEEINSRPKALNPKPLREPVLGKASVPTFLPEATPPTTEPCVDKPESDNDRLSENE